MPQQITLEHYDVVAFFDGVQLPLISVALTHAMNGTSADVVVEPNDLLDDLKPRSRVSVFVRDPYKLLERPPDILPATADDPLPENLTFEELFKQAYFLYWEGEFAGYTESETAQTRSATLHCVSIMSHIDMTHLQMTSAGTHIKWPMLNGSVFTSALDSSSDGLYLDSQVAAAFVDAEVAADQEPDNPTFNFGLRAVDFLSRISTRHADLYLRLKRSRFFERILALPDRIVATTLPLETMRRLGGQNLQQGIGMSGTVGDALNAILSYGHYSRYDIVPPVLHDVPAETKVTEGDTAQAEDVASGSRASKSTLSREEAYAVNRRDQVYGTIGVFPYLYYALPPRCNWVFPDHIEELSSGRNMLAEPTRLGMLDANSMTAVGQPVVHVAPPNLAAYLKDQWNPPRGASQAGDLSSQELSAVNIAARMSDGLSAVSISPLAAYTNEKLAEIFGTIPVGEALTEANAIDIMAKLREELEQGKIPSLVASMLPNELVKGIVYRTEDAPYETFAAAALAGASVDDMTAAIKQVTKTREQGVSPELEGMDQYMNFMQETTQFRLLMAQLGRTLSVTGVFNPDAQVGLPMIVLRDSRAYMGLLISKADSISSTGGANTTYQLAHVRVIPTNDVDVEAVAFVQDRETLRQKQAKFDRSAKFLNQLLPKVMADLEAGAIPALFAKHFNSSLNFSTNIGGFTYWDSRGLLHHDRGSRRAGQSNWELKLDTDFEGMFTIWSEWSGTISEAAIPEGKASTEFIGALSEISSQTGNLDETTRSELKVQIDRLQRGIGAFASAKALVDRVHEAVARWSSEALKPDTIEDYGAGDNAGSVEKSELLVDPWSDLISTPEGLDIAPRPATFHKEGGPGTGIYRFNKVINSFSEDDAKAITLDGTFQLRGGIIRGPTLWTAPLLYTASRAVIAYLDQMVQDAAVIYVRLKAILAVQAAALANRVGDAVFASKVEEQQSILRSPAKAIPPIMPSARPDYLEPVSADQLYQKYLGQIGSGEYTYESILGDHVVDVPDVAKTGDPQLFRFSAGSAVLNLVSRVRDQYISLREESGERAVQFVYDFVHRKYIYGSQIDGVFEGAAVLASPRPTQDEDDKGLLEIVKGAIDDASLPNKATLRAAAERSRIAAEENAARTLSTIRISRNAAFTSEEVAELNATRDAALQTAKTANGVVKFLDKGAYPTLDWGPFTVLPKRTLPLFGKDTEDDHARFLGLLDAVVIDFSIETASGQQLLARADEGKREADVLKLLTSDEFRKSIARRVFGEQSELPPIRRGR